MMTLLANDVIEAEGRKYRVLKVQGDRALLYLLDGGRGSGISGEEHSLARLLDGLRSGTVKKIADPYAMLRSSEPKPRAREKAAANYELIRSVVEDSSVVFDRQKCRQALVAKAAGSASLLRRLYRLLAMWMRQGMDRRAMIPDYLHTGRVKHFTRSPGAKSAGGTEKPLADGQLKQLFDEVLRQRVLKPGGESVRQAYAYLLSVYAEKYPAAAAKPTYWQFRNYFYSRWSRRERNELRTEKTLFQRDLRALKGTVYDIVDSIGQLYEIDATVDNVQLAATFDHSQPAGRPVLYLVTDVFSGMIAGFYISFDNAQYKSAAEALFCAVSDKREYFRRLYGLELDFEWNVSGLPQALCADNAELESPAVEHFARQYGIKICNTPTRRAELKGSVESSFFRTQHELKAFLKKSIVTSMTKLKKAGYIDNRTEGFLDINQYRKMVLLAVSSVNSRLRSILPAGYPPSRSPNVSELWNWAAASGRCDLTAAGSPQEIYDALMTRSAASVSREGLNCRGIRYTCAELERQGWFDRDKNSKQHHSPLMMINEGNVSKAVVIPDPQHQPSVKYPCTLARSCLDFTGLTLHEVRLKQELSRKQRQRSRQTHTDAVLAAGKKISEMVSEAAAQTNAAKAQSAKSRTEKLQAVQETRTAERIIDARLRTGETGPLPPQEPDHNAQPAQEDRGDEVKRYPPAYYELFKRS